MRRLQFILFIGLLISGCAITVPIKRGELYKPNHFDAAPTILVADLKDARGNKRDIGGIGLGYFVVNVDIAKEIHNTILKQLAERKLNIKIIPYEGIGFDINNENIKGLIKKNSSDALLMGDLEQFEIPHGADAALQTTDLVSRIFIRLFDAEGKKIYENKIMLTVSKYFGLASVGPAQDLVEGSISGLVSKLFDDQEFIMALKLLR